MSIEDKKQYIQPKHPKVGIQRQCELIGLSRSSYSREGLGGQETLKNLESMRLIDNEYTDHPFYGTRQIRNVFKSKGHKINRKRVQQNKVYPYLLRNFDVTRSNQVWCTDIAYIPLSGGFVYLTAVMDWHSRYVLSWELSITMDKEFCISSLERALRCHGTPYIFNTDQGSQYTSHKFTKVLKDKTIKISMDGKGRFRDNIFIERLWRSVKYEEIYINEFQSVEQLRQSLKKYFDFYNHERPHQSFKGQTLSVIYYGANQWRLVG